jgi:hypothetical protein
MHSCLLCALGSMMIPGSYRDSSSRRCLAGLSICAWFRLRVHYGQKIERNKLSTWATVAWKPDVNQPKSDGARASASEPPFGTFIGIFEDTHGLIVWSVKMMALRTSAAIHTCQELYGIHWHLTSFWDVALGMLMYSNPPPRD